MYYRILANKLVMSVLAGIIMAGFLISGSVASEYPSKRVVIIVGYGAGGGADTYTRAAQPALAEALGVPVLVRNKPGAGGKVAAAALAKAAADGYTLGVFNTSIFTLDPLLIKTDYKSGDFDHISIVTRFQEIYFTRSDAPFSSFPELLRMAKKTDKSPTFASFFELDRLIVDFMGKKDGIEFLPVPVSGGSAALQAVLGGHVDFGYSGGSWGPHLEAGDIKPVMAVGPERLPALPDLESTGDLGYKVMGAPYLAISAPAGIPDKAVKTLVSAFQKGFNTSPPKKVAKQRYMAVKVYGPGKTAELISQQEEIYKEMVATSRR